MHLFPRLTKKQTEKGQFLFIVIVIHGVKLASNMECSIKTCAFCFELIVFFF